MVAVPGMSLAQLKVAERGQVLPVSETFGPTIQGEGHHTGRRCWFLRLGECNLHCSWCDTKFTWDWANHDRTTELTDLTADQIGDRLHSLGAQRGDMVVLTGGEPLIHHHKDAFRRLLAWGFEWHLESNGTIWPGWECARAFAHVTLSPKIAQDDDPVRRRIKPRTLRKWDEAGADFKFVVRDGYDVKQVRRLVDTLELDPANVWCMAEGTTPWAILQRQAALADTIVAAGFNLTTRLHVLAWPGTGKGR